MPRSDEDVAQGAERVSTKRGWWSVGLALLSSAFQWPVALIVLIAFGYMFGPMGDPDFQAAFGIAGMVIQGLVVAMVVASVVLGVASIVGAWPKHGRPGRTAAIVLGCIGIVLSAFMAWYLMLVLPSYLMQVVGQ